MPTVEEYGVEPIPQELKTAGWRDLFAINFTFFLNPVMYVLGALAVVDGGLPLWWAVLAMVVGQALVFSHKILLSFLGFGVVLILLILHHRTGLRGRKAARWLLSGYLLLTLAYPGVKFVREILIGQG